MDVGFRKGNTGLDFKRCVICRILFSPDEPHWRFCPGCFREGYGSEQGWIDYWDWRIFGLAPHLNFDGWSNKFEREYYRLVWRDDSAIEERD